MGFKKSLIVCPKALLFVWQDEVKVHRPDLKLHVRTSMTWDVKIRRTKDKISDIEGREPLLEKDVEKLKRYRYVLRKLEEGLERDIEGARGADIIVINYEKCIQGEIELDEEGFPLWLLMKV